MKSLQFLTTALIAATLVIGGAGCKKTPKAVTTIPRSSTPIPSVDPGSGGPVTPRNTNIGPGRSITDTNPGGINQLGAGNDLLSKPISDEGVGQTGRPDIGDVTEDPTALQAETVYFDYDKSEVRSSERNKVEAVATYLKNNAGVMLKVEGNCDERGTEEYNRSLGERRALAVREYLVTLGIDAARINTISYGEDRPAVPGNDEAAFNKNRRADFVVLRPRTQLQ